MHSCGFEIRELRAAWGRCKESAGPIEVGVVRNDEWLFVISDTLREKLVVRPISKLLLCNFVPSTVMSEQ